VASARRGPRTRGMAVHRLWSSQMRMSARSSSRSRTWEYCHSMTQPGPKVGRSTSAASRGRAHRRVDLLASGIGSGGPDGPGAVRRCQERLALWGPTVEVGVSDPASSTGWSSRPPIELNPYYHAAAFAEEDVWPSPTHHADSPDRAAWSSRCWETRRRRHTSPPAKIAGPAVWYLSMATGLPQVDRFGTSWPQLTTGASAGSCRGR
jgi:hypothetical protein